MMLTELFARAIAKRLPFRSFGSLMPLTFVATTENEFDSSEQHAQILRAPVGSTVLVQTLDGEVQFVRQPGVGRRDPP